MHPNDHIAVIVLRTLGLTLTFVAERIGRAQRSGGVACPNLHDGMAVVDEAGESGKLILVRNHEGGLGSSAYIRNRPKITYLSSGLGETTNLRFDTSKGAWEDASASLAGTVRNCAGGVTPWGTWLTGEETFSLSDMRHAWQFEVGSQQGDPTPLRDMGRFSHEASMIDPNTGDVYETEDDGETSGFYKSCRTLGRDEGRRRAVHDEGRGHGQRRSAIRFDAGPDLAGRMGQDRRPEWGDDERLRARRGEERRNACWA